MEQLIKKDKEYAQWIYELAQRYRTSQIKAAVMVNDEMLRFYWSVGKDIEKRQMENRYGSHFYENVSKDLRKALGLTRGLSETTIRYTHYFFCLYSQHLGNLQQDAEDSQTPNHQQDAEDFRTIFSIPWTHHMCIIDKVKGDAKKGLFFVKKSLENNWGRSVLLNFLSSDLYERQGAAQTNFALTIPASESDLAQELLKSPYDFSFLPGKEKYQETELKNALIKHITNFLVELGKGFSFVGKEYRLVAGGKEKFIDLLFYIIPLHRYCVIEVKISEFDFPDLGQLAGYVAMVDDLMNTEMEKPAIGLLICKEKNNVLARYALSTTNHPMGISEYDIARQQLPDDLKKALPSPEEIEKGLMCE
ncbi:MAG: DUF1016 family protein [Bacteroidales bacterium]|nr:DUF1016 family protein [Bacteroidales bacterium]